MNYIKDLHDYNMEEPEQVKEFFGAVNIDRRKGIVSEIIDNEQSRLVDYATDVISDAAAYRAKNFLKKVLDGEEKAFMELIGGGRTREYGCDAGEPWAKLIHGSIYLTEGMKIRKAIIDTHRDLFESEYINDLESVIEGLKKQIINLEKRYGIN